MRSWIYCSLFDVFIAGTFWHNPVKKISTTLDCTKHKEISVHSFLSKNMFLKWYKYLFVRSHKKIQLLAAVSENS